MKKIVWSEGILLSQQHFQQWDQYREMQMQLCLKMFIPYYWGLQKLEIDEEALNYGKFKIKRIQGVFPNAKIFNFDDANSEALSCTIQANADGIVELFIAWPDNQAINAIHGYENNNSKQCAWLSDYQKINDIYDADRQQEILFACQNLIILQNFPEKMQAIKIAELKNNGNGGYQLIKQFIPTVLQVQSAKYLQDKIMNWLELFGSALITLQEYKKNLTIEISKDYIETTVIISSLTNLYSFLLNIKKIPTIHPYHIFNHISVSVLEIFSIRNLINGEAIPLYQHENLTKTFLQLDKLVTDVCKEILPVKTSPVILNKENQSFYSAVDIADNYFSDDAKFIIEILFAGNDQQWISQLLKQMKIGSAKQIQEIVAAALPGAKLLHMLRPPNHLLIKTGYEYFYIEAAGIFWEKIKNDKSLGIFIPADFANVRLDLIVLQEFRR